MSLYTIRHYDKRMTYMCLKVDDELQKQEAVYYLTHKRDYISCSCYRHNQHDCDHRRMLIIFTGFDRIDKAWFYNPDRQLWQEPIPYEF